MLRTTPRIVSPMPAGSPRHRRSAATTLASAEIPTAVATITLTTNSAHGSVVSGARGEAVLHLRLHRRRDQHLEQACDGRRDGQDEEQRPLAAEGVEGAPEHGRDVDARARPRGWLAAPSPETGACGDAGYAGGGSRPPDAGSGGGGGASGGGTAASSGVVAGCWASPPVADGPSGVVWSSCMSSSLAVEYDREACRPATDRP